MPRNAYGNGKQQKRCKHGVKELRQVAGIVQVQLLHALQGNLSQARHVHVIGRTHTKANDFIVDALAQILFDAATQCVLQVPENTGGGIANRQSGTGADYWYQKNTRAAAVILDSKCNGLAQRRSDADIRKQVQHHPAYTEADILLLPPSRRRRSLSIIRYSLMVCLRRYKGANFKLASPNKRTNKYPPANKREA